jgi:PHO85 cyclin-5
LSCLLFTFESCRLTNEYLIDQAVKSLCEIWHPQDIPSIFLSSSRAMVTVTPPSNPIPSMKLQIPQKSRNRNTQLLSPVSPSTQPSPCSPSSSISSPAATIQITPQYAAVTPSSRSHIVLIKGFVHEVLRRSRTSGGVLQTALCYLEAIRSKVPELLRKESMGEGLNEEMALDCRIVRGANLQFDLDPEANSGMSSEKRS